MIASEVVAAHQPELPCLLRSRKNKRMLVGGVRRQVRREAIANKRAAGMEKKQVEELEAAQGMGATILQARRARASATHHHNHAQSI